MSKNTRNRILLTAVAALLLVAVAVGGTVAYLAASTKTVVNTFTPTTISAGITESDTTTVGDKETKSWQIVPGVNITDKDPYVTASSDVDFYVFVEITEANWLTKNNVRMLDYTVALTTAGWSTLSGNHGQGVTIYYKDFTAGTEVNQQVLTNNTITVSQDITDEDMKEITAPTLTFKAYAIQKNPFTDAEAAWTAVSTAE